MRLEAEPSLFLLWYYTVWAEKEAPDLGGFLTSPAERLRTRKNGNPLPAGFSPGRSPVSESRRVRVNTNTSRNVGLRNISGPATSGTLQVANGFCTPAICRSRLQPLLSPQPAGTPGLENRTRREHFRFCAPYRNREVGWLFPQKKATLLDSIFGTQDGKHLCAVGDSGTVLRFGPPDQ